MTDSPNKKYTRKIIGMAKRKKIGFEKGAPLGKL